MATIGTGLSNGCRKLGITPFSRAGATSQLEFSVNHAEAQKDNGKRQFGELLLHDGALSEQIGLSCQRANR